jgi:hypothetical protein
LTRIPACGIVPARTSSESGTTQAMPELSESEKQEIQRYLKWGQKRLFRELDRYYGASSPGGKRASYRFKGKGRVWLHELLPSLQEFVCDEWGYPSKKDDPELQESEKLIVALGEALSPLLERNPFPTKAQVPAYLVAAILLEMGLDELCASGSQ